MLVPWYLHEVGVSRVSCHSIPVCLVLPPKCGLAAEMREEKPESAPALRINSYFSHMSSFNDKQSKQTAEITPGAECQYHVFRLVFLYPVPGLQTTMIELYFIYVLGPSRVQSTLLCIPDLVKPETLPLWTGLDVFYKTGQTFIGYTGQMPDPGRTESLQTKKIIYIEN